MPTGSTLEIIESYDTPNIGRYKINYNFSILAFSSFTGIAASVFTNPNPTTADVGGVPAGSTFAGDHYLQEMMDLLLYPAVTPNFTSFLISGQATQIEVGTAIAGSNTFTWAIANTADLQANSIDIDDTTNATNIASGLANDGTETVFLSSVSKTTPSSNLWTISADDTDGNVFSRTFTVSWLYASFYGTNVSTTLNAAAIVALAESDLQEDINNSYVLAGTGYGYICVPNSFSCPTGFRDSTTNVPIDTAGPNEGYTSFDGAFYFDAVSVTRNGVPITYRVYRTRDSVSSITVSVSLTGGSVSTLQSVINAGNIATGNAAIIGDFSATTFYSGNTPFNTILASLTGGGGSGATTYVQPGLNITTGGTATSPIISTVASPTFTGVTAESVFSTSLSGGTLYSGNTEVGGLIQSLVSAGATHVQPGTNITTGGTPFSPIINTSLDPVFDSVSASTISATTITTNVIDAIMIMSGGTDLGLLIPDQQNLEQVTTQGNSTTIGITLSGASIQSPLLQFDTSPAAGGCFIFTFFDNGITTFYNFSDSFVFQSFKTGTTFSFISDSGVVMTSNPHEPFVRRGYADIAFQNIENSIIYSGVLTSDLVSTGRTWHLPDASGTIALTSQFDNFLHISGGTVTGGTVFTSLSATTLYSGNTELSQLLGGGQSTHVQPGSNIYTGGTASNPIVGVIGSPIFTGVTAQTISGTSISATTLYSGGTNLQNIFSPYEHTHLSSAITDGSTGGNGTADYGKVAKYNTEGQLHGSSVNSVTEAVKGVSTGTGNAMGAIALSGTGLYAQSTYGIGVIGVTSDQIAGRFFNNSSGDPALEVYNLDPTNVGPIAHFHADDGLGMEMLNDGGLQWTTLTGAATTRTNLGLSNVFVSPGANAYTASTSANTIVGVIGSPIFTAVTAQSISGTSISATTFYSGNTNINNLLGSRVQPGENMYTAGTPSSQIVGLNGTIFVTGVTATSNNGNSAIVGSNTEFGYGIQGNGTDQPGVMSYSLSGLGFFVNTDSDGEDLAYFTNFQLVGLKVKNDGGLDWNAVTGAATTRANLGLNNYFLQLSGGTGGPYSFIGTTTAATIYANVISATTISATTFYSGNTELSTLLVGGQSTHVQPGSNIYTGGTASNPIVGVIGSPIFTGVTAQTISGTSISATTIYSGNTELGQLLNGQRTRVQPGSNTYTGGTEVNPIVGVIGSPVFTAVTATSISATTFTESGTTLSDKYAPKNLALTVTSGTYTLALTDNSRLVDMTGGTAQNLVVPPNSAIAFPTGAQVAVFQSGAGQVSFSAGTGVTIQSYQSHVKIAGQYGGASLVKKDTNVWALFGNLSA